MKNPDLRAMCGNFVEPSLVNLTPAFYDEELPWGPLASEGTKKIDSRANCKADMEKLCSSFSKSTHSYYRVIGPGPGVMGGQGSLSPEGS